MALFDSILKSLGVGVSEQESASTAQKTEQQKQTQKEQQTQLTTEQQLAQLLSQQFQKGTETAQMTGATTGEQAQVATTLDEATQALLSGLLQQTGSTVGGGDLVSLLTSRAATAPGAETVAPIVAQARKQIERDIGRTQTQLAGEAGSSLNTLVQQLGIEGRIEAETALAALAAQLQQQARQAQTGEIATASQIGQQQLAALADLLKGATTTGTTKTAQQQQQQTVAESATEATTQQEQKQQATQQTQTQRTLEALIDAIMKSSGTSKGEGYQDPIAGWIGSAIGSGGQGAMATSLFG